MNRDYTIVTIANKNPELEQPYYTFSAFFKSLQDVKPLILGSMPGEYGGLGSKPRLVYSAIKDNKITTSHIVFCDCFDLVLAVHPDQLFSEYKDFKSSFVISTEKNCFPDTYKKEYDQLPNPSKSIFRYLNSGMIVAEVAAMEIVLEAMDAKNIPNDYWSEEKNCRVNPNDQEYYQKIFLEQPVPMTLDVDQILCGTLHETKPDELDFSEQRISRKENGSYPCSWHMNGNGKTSGCRELILKHLNLL